MVRDAPPIPYYIWDFECSSTENPRDGKEIQHNLQK
jgi:hypothetical protein